MLVVLAWTGIAVAQAEGGWPQYQGGAGHPGAAPDGPAPAYDVRWTHAEALSGPEGASGLSAPIVFGDLVVAVGVDDVVAVGLTDGEERWRVKRRPGPPVPPAVGKADGRSILVYTEGYGPNPPGASASSPASSSATPTASGSPSAGADLDTRVVAVDIGDQKELWSTDLPSASRSGVSILDGAAYVGTNDGSVTAVDLASGDVRWTVQVGGPIDSPLAAEAGLVLCPVRGETGTAFSVAALHDTDGSQAWRFEPDSASTVGGSPAVLGETGYVGIADQTVRAFSMDAGLERWSSRMNAPMNLAASPVVTSDAVFAADIAGQVYRFDPSTGARVWDHALNVPVFRSAAVLSGTHVLLPSADGDLFALEGDGGDLVWRGNSGAAGTLRSLAVAGDLVVAVRGGSDPGLVAFGHDAAGALIRVVTPTTLAIGRLLASFTLAAVPLIAVFILLGRSLAARMGPALPEDDEPLPDEEPPPDDGPVAVRNEAGPAGEAARGSDDA